MGRWFFKPPVWCIHFSYKHTYPKYMMYIYSTFIFFQQVARMSKKVLRTSRMSWNISGISSWLPGGTPSPSAGVGKFGMKLRRRDGTGPRTLGPDSPLRQRGSRFSTVGRDRNQFNSGMIEEFHGWKNMWIKSMVVSKPRPASSGCESALILGGTPKPFKKIVHLLASCPFGSYLLDMPHHAAKTWVCRS